MTMNKTETMSGSAGCRLHCRKNVVFSGSGSAHFSRIFHSVFHVAETVSHPRTFRPLARSSERSRQKHQGYLFRTRIFLRIQFFTIHQTVFLIFSKPAQKKESRRTHHNQKMIWIRRFLILHFIQTVLYYSRATKKEYGYHE